MKTLIAEDEFISRKLISKMMSSFGEVDITVDGEEAVSAFVLALDEGEPYDLLCLDIMMPVRDGIAALKEIRRIEAARGITIGNGVKVMMTTALSDSKHILGAFREGCEAYIVKPLTRDKILVELNKLNLVDQ